MQIMWQESSQHLLANNMVGTVIMMQQSLTAIQLIWPVELFGVGWLVMVSLEIK